MPLRDRLRPNPRVLFVGINPGTRSEAIGHHFAGYSNRFWKLLHEARIVPEPMRAEDDDRLPEWGIGITNLIARATPGMDTLTLEEYIAGLAILRRKVRRVKPAIVAFVGVSLYRFVFGAKGAVSLGPQRETFENARVFVLPNPSGRNANFSYAEMLRAYRRLARALGPGVRRDPAKPRAMLRVTRASDRGPDPVQVQPTNRVRAGRQQR